MYSITWFGPTKQKIIISFIETNDFFFEKCTTHVAIVLQSDVPTDCSPFVRPISATSNLRHQSPAVRSLDDFLEYEVL